VRPIAGLAAAVGAVWCAAASGAIVPVSQGHDLVAGAGAPGFADGEFYRARFHAPAGLALIAGRSVLLVSDRQNNRIRAIWLEENNRVSTLAGSGEEGSRNGTLEKASFHLPGAMILVSDRLLVVNDEGNALFRMIDLKRRSVETLAGSGGRGVFDGQASGAYLGGVWNLAYVPDENALYFSQPEFHALRRLDLKSRTIATVLRDDPRIPAPTALALFRGKLHVADRDGRVYRLESFLSGDWRRPQLRGVWSGERILAMSASQKDVYALEGCANPAWRSLSTGRRVPFPVVWAEGSGVPYLWLEPYEPAVLVADPRRDRSFFLTSPSLNSVLCVKDYRFEQLTQVDSLSETGLTDFEYPLQKPERTFRILLLGDSRMFTFDVPGREEAPDPGTVRLPERKETIPKRLELGLNSLAALEGADLHYEVLTLGRVIWEPLLVWPNYEAADIVRRFDVDSVILMLPPETATLDAYLNRPITAEGIPVNALDPEYLLKPHTEKIRGNPAQRFVERCRALGWADIEEGQIQTPNLQQVLTDPIATEELLRLYGRPLRGIRERLRALPGRKPPTFTVCYFPTGGRGSGVAEEGFWRDLCKREKVGWVDLVGPLTVLKETWFPLQETENSDHFTTRGHSLVAFVLAHELIHNGVIPWRRRVPWAWPVILGLASLAVLLAAAGLLARRRRRQS
jgi:hypothetical protein